MIQYTIFHSAPAKQIDAVEMKTAESDEKDVLIPVADEWKKAPRIVGGNGKVSSYHSQSEQRHMRLK